MHPIDWILTTIPLFVVLGLGLFTQQYMQSVSHFLTGGRLAGRYLLAVAGGELQAGAVVFVALFEVIGNSGFTASWWGAITTPVWLYVGVSGFVIYRYRQTRAMTLAQFFELRYSKSYRIFTGFLGFIAGMLNFGIIPAIGSRFLVYFWGLPPTLTVYSFTFPTYIPLMAVFLSIAVFVTLSGGVITLMMVNCVEGIMSQIFYLIIIAALLLMFSWSQISHVLTERPPGQSYMNPFDSLGLKDFSIWYIIMSLLLNIYGTGAWQNASAYNAAASSAHEMRMSRLISNWRELGKLLMITLLGICSLTFLTHPAFAHQAETAQGVIHHISDPQTQEQMRLPIAISYLLPIGIKGLFCAILLMGIFGGDATHLHSWGSIFIQDVLVPLRKKPFTPDQHIRFLRMSIIGVAIFAFLFGSLFRQTEYVIMWFTITTAIYVGGAGAAIIGGLYWVKGTTPGAWTALITGSVLSVGGIVIRQIYGNAFPLNGQQISFIVMLIAISLYIVVSLLTHQEDFNMDRLLHRGAYASLNPLIGEQTGRSRVRQRNWFEKLIELDDNFTKGDKWLVSTIVAWTLFWFVAFLIVFAWNLVAPWPVAWWSDYFHFTMIGIPVFMAAATSIWFTWGGVRDTRNFFRQLNLKKINPLDDGTVVNHQNLDEFEIGHAASGSVAKKNREKPVDELRK
jgi:SSS family solute:Na+ symporter